MAEDLKNRLDDKNLVKGQKLTSNRSVNDRLVITMRVKRQFILNMSLFI